MRAAVLAQDRSALAEAVQTQQTQAHAGRDRDRRRVELRAELAVALGCDVGAATLGALAERLPESTARQLVVRQERLTRLAADAGRLSYEVAGLVCYCLDFLNHCFAGLADTEPGGRYGPAGRPERPLWGPVIEARG